MYIGTVHCVLVCLKLPCVCPLFQSKNNKTPFLVWRNILELTLFLVTSHNCSPELEESNYGFCSTAISHQMKLLGSISGISKVSL